MLSRIHELIKRGEDFALETTLATKSFLGMIQKARQNGYFVSLVFFWLESPDLAIYRVQQRVNEGGHNIPEEVIRRRYFRGIENLFKLFLNEVDYLVIFDNSEPELIAEKKVTIKVLRKEKFELMKSYIR